MIFKFFIFVFGCSLLGAGCSVSSPSYNEPQTAVIQPTHPPSRSNLFSASNKPGDIVAGLKLVSIGSVPGATHQPFGRNNVQAQFDGKITVSGQYVYDNTGFYMSFAPEEVCIGVTDPQELAKLPLLDEGDYEYKIETFCFTNLEKAKASFGPKYGTGKATVIIDHYISITAPNDFSLIRKAELVNMVSKEPIN